MAVVVGSSSVVKKGRCIMAKQYGYAQVKTFRQETGDNCLETQKKVLWAAGAEEIVEARLSGKKYTDTKFSALINNLKPGDTLIVTTFDKLAPTIAEGAEVVRSLLGRGVAVDIQNMTRADDSEAGRLFFKILTAFAQYEQDKFIDHSQVGRAIAREQGKKVDGRPKKYPVDQLDHAMSLLDGHSFNEVERLTGISRSTLLRESKERKEKAALSSRPENNVETTKEIVITREKEFEEKAILLANRLGAIPSTIKLEHWLESINQLDEWWSNFPDNEEIALALALALALGRSSPPRVGITWNYVRKAWSNWKPFYSGLMEMT